MAASEELGILRMSGFDYFVRDPARSAAFYTERFGWGEVARSTPEGEARTGHRSVVYGAGEVRVQIITAMLRNPDSRSFLLARGATPVDEPCRLPDPSGGLYRAFSVTTAWGDVRLRFVERRDLGPVDPGFVASAPSGGDNPFGFGAIDHVTANALTMAPVVLWMEQVLGMEECWRIEFHTSEYAGHPGGGGTGLKSRVMWDPRSELKFPINEPRKPAFEQSQIYTFCAQNRGPGIQHMAVTVENILEAVQGHRERGVEFLHTPGTYYDQTPARLAERGVSMEAVREPLEALRATGVLIDGSPEDRYLLQIFLKDAALLYDDPSAGPFFYELIQRQGDPGFGEGNFKALFEAIERDQAPGAA